MMLPAGVVQSIDANIVDLDNGWIRADQDIWSQDYSEVLLQPISIEAVDINDLRFKSAEVVVDIRATPDPTSLVLWSGWCETVDDPSGSTPDLDTRISCGVLDPVPPVFVDNGNGTASIFGFRCAVRPVPDYTASPLDFDIPAATLTFANNTESYVCVKYNAGAPVMYVESSQAAINGSDVVLIFVVWRTGNELHSVSTDSRGIGLADKIAGMITRTKPYSLMHGQQLTLGVVTTPAVRTVTIAAATIYAGVDAIPLTALNSSNPAQRFTRVAPTAGVYGFLNQTQLDNTNYSDGTNVVALGANRYSPRWVYRTVGDDVQAFYVLGGEYSNIASAQAAPLPTGLPLVVQDHAVLVGRIIIQAGVDTPVQIDQVVSTTFATSTANMHNNLDGLQGTGPDYYHMDVTRWTNTGNGPWLPLTAGSGNTLTGTLYGTAGAEFGNGGLVLVTQGSGSTLAQTYTRGGDLSLAGNSGRANLRIMGSISADTAGVGPGLSFAGVSTGVGATGGGMLLQLATNNGLDIYSWNNTAWVKKSQINSAGMIAVVGGTAAGFLKANGTIDTTEYLTKANPAFTGTLTGPTVTLTGVLTAASARLASNAQELLTLYRGSSAVGNTHGINFAALNGDSIENIYAKIRCRIVTSVAGSESSELQFYAEKNNVEAKNLSVYGDYVSIGSVSLYQNDGGRLLVDSTGKGNFQGITVPTGDVSISKFGVLTELVGSTTAGAIYPTGVTPSASNYALVLSDSGAEIKLNASTNVKLSIANVNKLSVGVSTLDAPDLRATLWDSLTLNANTQSQSNLIFRNSTNYWTSMYVSATEAGFRDYTDAGAADSYPIYWTLKAGGLIRMTRVVNMLQGFNVNGTACVDASRNASFVNLTSTGIAKISSTSGAYLYVDGGTGTASGVQMQYGGVTQAITRYIGPAGTGAYQIVAYSGGTELDYPVNINMASGGLISLNRPVNISTFGLFRRYPGSTTSSGLFGIGVATPSTTNYSVYLRDDGESIQLNGSVNVCLNLVDVRKLQLTSAGVDLINGCVFRMNGTTAIDTSRNAWLDSVTTNGTYGTCGLFSGNGDAASYTTQNVKLSSWYGIGFPCTFDSTTRVFINTRNGLISTTGSLTASGGLTSGADLTFTNSGTSTRGIVGTVGDNDFWRIVGGASASNAGFLEIATADDGNEPIYVRQYTGTFGSIARQVTLLDEYGNSTFQGNVNCGSVVASGDWIQAVGANTKGRFKSQFSGNKASYLGNWPANNWWGIGSDGSTTGTSGVIKVGQCDGDGAWVVNGIQMYVIGHINVAQTGVFGSSITAASASLSPGVDGSGPVLTIDRGGASQAMTRGLKLSCHSSVIGNANPRIELADGSSVMSIDNYGQNLRLYASTVVGSATVMLSGNAAGMTFGVPTRLNERIADITTVPSTVTLAAGMSEIIYMSTANQTLTLNTDTATIGYAWDICVLAAGCTLNTSSTPRALYYNGSAYSQTNMALTQYKMYRLVKVSQNGYFLMG